MDAQEYDEMLRRIRALIVRLGAVVERQDARTDQHATCMTPEEWAARERQRTELEAQFTAQPVPAPRPQPVPMPPRNRQTLVQIALLRKRALEHDTRETR